MLGWAKKEVRRLMTYAGLDVFSRKWVFGDVTVTARVFEGVARLWLEAAGTERLAVWAKLPNPVPWRGLSIVRAQYGTPSISSVKTSAGAGGLGFIEVYKHTVRNSAGNVVAEYEAYNTMQNNSEWVEEPYHRTFSYSLYRTGFSVPLYTNIPRPVGPIWQAYSGSTTVNAYSGAIVSCSGEWVDLGYEALLAADIATGTGGSKTLVITSDGEVLAQEVENSTTHGDIPCREFTPAGAWVANGTTVSEHAGAWTGGERVAMYHSTFGILAFDHWLDFDVPEDIAEIPNTGYAPSDQLCWAVGDTYAPYGVGTYTPLRSITSYMDERAEGRDLAKARRAAWFKKNSDAVIQMLRDGVLPEKWDYQFKRLAPASANTYRPVALSADYTDEMVSDTTAGLTQAGTQIHKRTVTFKYTVIENGVPVLREATVVGTMTVALVDHKRATGELLIRSMLYTANDYYSPTWALIYPTTGVAEQDVYHQFLKDGEDFGMGLLWNGTMQRNAVGIEYAPDSTEFGGPTNNFLNPLPPQFNIHARDIFPPIPFNSTDISGTAPAFVRTYHADVKPQYRASGGNTDWLSSSLMPGMTVTVVPVTPVKDDEPLGIYGEVENTTEVTQVEVYGAAVFAYDYDNGAFTFKEWKALPSGAGSVRIQITADEEGTVAWNGYNALLIYGGIKWDDVKETARAQRKALADPNDPAHDPLMKAVLTALTPAE